jgi:hypothetical protein
MLKLFKYSVITFILFVPNTLLATNWANEFPLYIYGDVSFIATIYEFINSIVADETSERIVMLGMTITAFLGGIKLNSGNLEGFGKDIIAPLTLLALFFTPSVDVHITDVRVDKGYIDHTLSPDGGYQKVESVPYAIAFLPASAMLLVNLTVDLIDQNWASVHIANKLSATGFQLNANAIVGSLQTNGFFDGVDNNTSKYEYDLSIYIRECIVTTALTYNGNVRYANSPDKAFPDNLKPSNFPVNFGNDQIDYEDYDNITHSNVKCKDAYNSLVADNTSKILAACSNQIKKKFPTLDLNSESANKAFQQIIGEEDKAIKEVGSLKKAVATTVAAKFFQKQKSLDAVGVDGYSTATEISIQTTLANMRSEGPAKFKWISETLPDTILIISGIFIAAFPLLIIVQSFMGANAFGAIANYFMGFFAFYFNFVGLALVQNIISFYTKQEAQQTIALSMDMPFSAGYISDFVIQQANMTGLAGLIGAASVVAVTPLIFYGESRGFAAAMGAVTGAFKGGIDDTAKNTLKNNHLENELEARIDQELLEETKGMTNEEAGSWLAEQGINRRSNMSALDTYTQIMQGYNQIGAGLTAKDLVYSGNVGDYIEGSYLANTQQANKTAGMGKSIDSVQNAGEVSMQDGMVMAESINSTDRMRNVNEKTMERNLGENYDTESIGTGMAAQQFAKDKGMEYTGSKVLEGFDSNDALYQVKQDKLDNLLTQQSQAGMQTSKEDYIEHGKMARKEANNIADNINNISDEVDMLNAKKQDGGLDAVEEARLSQIQDEWKSLSNDWKTANSQVTSDFNASQSAKPQSQIDSEVASFDNAISQAKSELDNFNGGEINEAVASLVASSVNQSVAQIASGEGIIDSGGFKEDGSFNSEGSQGKILETGYYNQSRMNANKTMGMGLDGEVTTEQMTNTQTSSLASMLSEFQEGRTLKENFGHKLNENGSYAPSIVTNQDEIDQAKNKNKPLDEDIASFTKKRDALIDKAGLTDSDAMMSKLLNEADGYDAKINTLKSQKSLVPEAIIEKTGNKEEISFDNMIENETSNKLAGRMGSAKAFDDIGFDMAASNAQFGATSQALSTAAKIATQGGVDKAVATDVAEASMKAAIQQGATKGQIEELAKKSGMNDEAAKLFSSEIIKGSQEASELIKKGITDAGKDLSFSMSASKTGSDIANIDQAGGSKSFIERAKTQSTIKSENDNLDIKSMTDAGIINNKGNITDIGSAAMEIPHIEKANAMIGKAKVGERAEDIVSNARSQAFTEGMIKFNNNEKLANKYADDVVAPYFENGDVSNGKVLSGNDFWKKQAELKAGVFSGSNTMAFGNAHTFSGVLSQDGQLAGNLSGGLSSTFNKSAGYTEGININTNLGNAQTVGGQKAREATEHMFSLQKLAGMLVGKTFDESSTMLQENFNMSKENADNTTTAALMGGAALTVAGATELSQRAINYSKGNYKAKEGFEYKAGSTWDLKDGEPIEKPIMKEVKKGQSVNINSNPELREYFDNNKGNFSLEKGTPGKVMGRLLEEGDKDSLFKSRSDISNSTFNESEKVSTDTQNGNTQNKKADINKNSTHIETPSSNFDNSITQNTDDFKKTGNMREVDGKTYVDGVDPKGNEKSYNANHKTSRESYLRNNVGASSTLPTSSNVNTGGKLSSTMKGGLWGTLATATASTVNDLAHGRDWNHTLNATGNALVNSVEQEGIAGTARDMLYAGKDNRMLIQNASNEGSFIKTASLMGASVVESFAELGGGIATGMNNYSRAAANTIFGNGNFTQNLLAQEKDDNNNNYNFTKDLNSFMTPNNYVAPTTLGTMNPQTGAITPNPTAQNLPSFFTQNQPGPFMPVGNISYQNGSTGNNSYENNGNPFANNTSQSIADTSEDSQSYMRDMSDSMEGMFEQQETMMEFIRVSEKK